MSESQTTNGWRVIDWDNNANTHTADSRDDAEQKKATALDFGSENVEIVPPGQEPQGPDRDGEESDVEVVDATPVEPSPEPATGSAEAGYDLDERTVSDDPLQWMPGDFIDTIDGSQAINRKGFEVLAYFYDITTESSLEVPPEETGHEYCRVKATASMPDGRSADAYGSAHVERGDDESLLLEMADTRARKRALSIVSGVGAIAVEELKNEVDA